MKKAFSFVCLMSLSALAWACGTASQHQQMARRLYESADMRRFVCGDNPCALRDFEGGLLFERYDQPYRATTVSVCLITPKLIATNSYTGVFAGTGGHFAFQYTSYGTGVKVGVTKNGVPMISEGGHYDPNDDHDSINQYVWNGEYFVFSRSVRAID